MMDVEEYANNLAERMRASLLGSDAERQLPILLEELATYPPLVATAFMMAIYLELPVRAAIRGTIRTELWDAVLEHVEADARPGHCLTCSGTGEGGHEYERCHACNGKGSR